ncbi:DUF1684 domain-containing protein [Lacinutrix neustonica]|uniref:DUF1684 domain-containing protein n=1 Tax=Lacinutrix neustonica TaxID=2980107 RepID=A0A9E8MUL2_9FLAO|nr:DUF1684 domain-containing protein [Lacinutrix neustonica]WAC01828.1 DUF1684 domain-containing protein [Lacinutrix neustonica]
MKNICCLVFLCVSLLSCAQDKEPLLGETQFQREMNSEYKDATKSPLKAKDLKDFEGLDFFKFDATLVVRAKLERTPNTKYFKMKTTTSRVSLERIYGVLTFDIKDVNYKLNVYQGKELTKQEEYKDYLFLPFLDDSNGDGSYAGGRYIDLTIPKGDSIIIDFNTAYNPYCAYNEKYSCPIVPRDNYLATRVEAGVKAFKKH